MKCVAMAISYTSGQEAAVAVNRLTQAAFKKRPDMRREGRMYPLGRDQKAVEGMIMLVFRQSPGALAPPS